MAEALAGTVATSGVIQSVQSVLGTVAGYVKEIIVQVARFGRQVIRISYDIAKEIARPEVGVPFAILVYNASKLIRIDKTGVISAINSYFENIKTLNPVDIAWNNIKSGLSRVIDVSKVNNYWDLLNPFIAWDAINSSPIAPKLVINILGYTIDLGVIPRILMFIPLYPTFVMLCIPMFILNLTWGIIWMIIEVQKSIITSIVGFVIDVLGWVGNVLSWLACTYLKIVQPIVPMYFGVKNIDRGFKRAITSAIGGTLFTWVMMYAFASECVSVGIPSFPSPTPIVQLPTAPSPAIPSMEYTVIKSIKPLVSTTSLPPTEVRIDKSLKIQFFWSRIGITEYAVNKTLKSSIEYIITTLIERTIDKILKPSVEYTIIEPARITIDKTLKPLIEYESVQFTEIAIDKTVKPEIESIVLVQELTIEKSLKQLVEYTVTKIIEVAIEESLKPELVTPIEIIIEKILDKLLKPSIVYQIFNLNLMNQIGAPAINAYVKISDISIDTLKVGTTTYTGQSSISNWISIAQFNIEIETS